MINPKLEELVKRTRQNEREEALRKSKIPLFPSWHPDYTETLYVHETESRFQKRLRMDLEGQSPEFHDDFDEQFSRAGKALGAVYDRCSNSDGSIDYEKSDVTPEYKEYRRLSRIYATRKIAEIENRLMNKEIAEDLKQINMTQSALNKMEYVASKTLEINHSVGRKPTEIAMLMTADEVKDHRPIVISDIIVPEQKVTSVLCTITNKGDELAREKMKKEGKRYVGWAHSHSVFDTFYSDTDDKTISRLMDFSSVTRRFKTRSDLKYNVFFGVVVNDRHDTPAVRALCRKPRFVAEDGNLRIVYDTVDFEATEKISSLSKDKRDMNALWPRINIVQDNKLLDTEALDKSIVDNLIYDDDVRLRDIYRGLAGVVQTVRDVGSKIGSYVSGKGKEILAKYTASRPSTA